MENAGAPFQEQVVQFGPSRGLVGILTRPATQAPHGVHAIIFNTGIIHRVGSSRLSVTLARALASHGVTCLRFDLSGIGDSERRKDVASVRESVDRDTDDAAQYLAAAHGAQRLIVIGLCSGAFDAFRGALMHDQVVGALMVDMPGPFRTWRHTLHHFVPRLLRPQSWTNPLSKLLAHWGRLRAKRRQLQRTLGYVVGGRGSYSLAAMRQDLDLLLLRGVHLRFVFTMGLPENYNHRSQFSTTFPRAARHPLLSHEFYPEPDHAFARGEVRERLTSQAVAWTLGVAGGGAMVTEPPSDR